MHFDIDVIIVVSFLILTLIVGLGHGQKVKNIKDYALGGRNFSTGALVATIVATWASGSGFFLVLSKTYSDGFSFMLADIGGGISFLLLSLLFIPRMGEFLGKTSIAEAMGDLYGQNVRMITAIAGTIGAAGVIAAQFKIFGNVFSYFLKIPGELSIIIAGLIATIYSAFGGIRSVTFTDVLQGIAFGVIIPFVGFILWSKLYNQEVPFIHHAIDRKFDLRFLLSSENPDLWGTFALFCYFAIPTFSAPAFQRIAMGRDIEQVKKAFIISGICLVIINLSIAWIPFLVYKINNDLASNKVLGFIIDTYAYVGLKGLVLVAIIAFAMSTADSRINAASVLFTNDLYKLLVNNPREIFISRFFAILLGISAITFALIETDLLGVIVFANSFYYPLVTPPFILTVLGFRSSSKSVLIGMMVGLIVTVVWKFLPPGFLPVSQKIIGVLFAMVCNTIFLLASHYLLHQPGGWVGVKDRTYLDEQKIKRQQDRANFYKWLNEFSFRAFCKKLAPHREMTYVALGVYFVAYTITTMYTTQVELLGPNAELMKVIYPLMLVSGTMMMMYPIWPLSIATSIKKAIIETWYPIAVFYMLIFFSCFFVLVSKFAMLQVALFVTNLMIAALLLGWRVGLPFIAIGFYAGIEFYQYFFGQANFEIKFGSPEFVLIYLVIFLGSTVIFFLKTNKKKLRQKLGR